MYARVKTANTESEVGIESLVTVRQAKFSYKAGEKERKIPE